VLEPEQLDIFIPLQRTERFLEWARLAREQELDLAAPGGASELADWLRESGRAPAGLSAEGLNLLVAAMPEYVGPTSTLPMPAGR